MLIVVLKVAITVTVVSALSIIAERISPRAAGILSGYPLGSAISLFFIGFEQSPAFAGESAIYNVAGMTALLSFFFIYYQVSARVRQKTASILLASLCALVGFLSVDAILHFLKLPPWGCLLIGSAGVIGYGLLFRSIPEVTIARRVHLSPGVMVFRAALAALVILSITGAAKIVPASWAGLFSAFPATVFPLILILHTTYGAEQAHTVIRNVPTGLWALVLYSLTISFTYPRFGIYWGTLMGFAVATLYLFAFALLSQARTQPAKSAKQVSTTVSGAGNLYHPEK